MRPVELTTLPATGGYAGTENIGAGVTTHWWAYLRDSAPYIIWDGIYTVCFDFKIAGGAGDGSDLYCDDVCAVTYEGSYGTPTPTRTPTNTSVPATNTPWPTSASTATRTPTTGV